MAKRIGKATVILDKKPKIIANAALVGKKEGEGPLGKEFDIIYQDTTLGEESWEKAESTLLQNTVKKAFSKAAVNAEDVQAIFAGDLLAQSIGSTFALRSFGVPVCGLFGACSTMALSLCQASLAIETGGFDCTAAATASHFCSSEKQFRYPLEYGGQRPPTAQWTVTGAGCAVLKDTPSSASPYIEAVQLGEIRDYDITDANNMGAAMAPVDVKIEP